ncbi:MAG TPA: hypothetical protein VMT38_00770 [Terracidiphilus sp.]|nr:hypothetical protein [Terracidiphilus sp.]
MKIGRFTLSGVSVALLVFQLLVVSSVAGKYLWQRWRCPRVWTRAAAFDPVLPMRGRYLSLRLTVDGCQSTLPSAKFANFPRDVNGAIKPGPYVLRPQPVYFRANLKVENNQLVALRPEGVEFGGAEDSTVGQEISAPPGAPCNQMQVADPVDFYIADTAKSPLPLTAGRELWIEVTVPPKGPPRPLALAVKDNGVWKPLAFQ